jgi:hypothetical protein
MDMKLAHLTTAIAIISATTACSAERAVSPASPSHSIASSVVSPAMMQVPLLYVVDGVRLQRDQIPTLTSEQVSEVRVIKGHAALKQYGPDASYGVVLITTKNAPRT